MYLLIFEFLGTNELLVILVVALVLLGPRKLPQMSRKLGKSLSEFKRASEDFKRTWEREVEMESASTDARLERAMLPAENSILNNTVGRQSATGFNAGETLAGDEATAQLVPAPSVTQVDPSLMQPSPTEVLSEMPATNTTAATTTTASTPPPPQRKRDWL